MPKIIKIPTFTDNRGKLSVVDKLLPFEVKRVFYIYDVKEKRGGHGHKYSTVALIAINGPIRVKVENSEAVKYYHLNSPDEALILDPEDWHEMDQFDPGAVLLVLSSHHYDQADYFFEPYEIKESNDKD
jgi:hypothetical protein